MQARYSKDDEIAIINNKLTGNDADYVDYSAYRVSVKTQVDDAGYPKITVDTPADLLERGSK